MNPLLANRSRSLGSTARCVLCKHIYYVSNKDLSPLVLKRLSVFKGHNMHRLLYYRPLRAIVWFELLNLLFPDTSARNVSKNKFRTGLSRLLSLTKQTMLYIEKDMTGQSDNRYNG